MTIAAERILQVTFQYTSSGNRLSCVMHYARSGSVLLGDPKKLADAWRTAVVSLWQAAVSQEITFEALYVSCVKKETVAPYYYSFVSTVGGVAEEAIPANVAGVIKLLQSEETGKHNGRVFVSGIPETVIENSILSAGYMAGAWAALAGVLAAQLTDSSAVDWLPCIVMRQLNGVEIEPLGLQVIAAQQQQNLATQRRRTTELRQYHP